MKLTIQGELTDLNTFINALKRNKFVGQKIKNDETDRVAWEVAIQKAKPITKYPVLIHYKWYSKNARKDTDNVAFAKKFIKDGLVRAEILEDDSRKFVAGFSDRFYIDKENPRVEFEIESLAGATSTA